METKYLTNIWRKGILKVKHSLLDLEKDFKELRDRELKDKRNKDNRKVYNRRTIS